jgi:hypothetical protein
MGESCGVGVSARGQELEAFSVETPGGRIHIRWDCEASATPNAQLAFFAEFLATTGVYESRLNSGPRSYSSGNASKKRDVLGTWFLSILAGHDRYAHITALRGDGVSPQILGMSEIVSEDAMRRALAGMRAKKSRDWLQPQPLASVQAALKSPWMLDIYTTVKALVGKQSGRRQVTTRTSRAVQATHCALTLQVTCGWFSMSSFAPANSTAPPTLVLD